MILGSALLVLVDFARENGGEERRDVKQALKTVSKKAEALRVRREALRVTTACACGQYQRTRKLAVCHECWKAAPDHLRRAMNNAISDGAKRSAARDLIEWARTHAGNTREALA